MEAIFITSFVSLLLTVIALGSSMLSGLFH